MSTSNSETPESKSLDFGTSGSFDEKVPVTLKVLSCWMDGQAVSSEDIQRLRSYMPELACLPPDELACAVMQEHHRR